MGVFIGWDVHDKSARKFYVFLDRNKKKNPINIKSGIVSGDNAAINHIWSLQKERKSGKCFFNFYCFKWTKKQQQTHTKKKHFLKQKLHFLKLVVLTLNTKFRNVL